jgi:hypothetical protein
MWQKQGMVMLGVSKAQFPSVGMLSSGDRPLRRLKWSGEEKARGCSLSKLFQRRGLRLSTRRKCWDQGAPLQQVLNHSQKNVSYHSHCIYFLFILNDLSIYLLFSSPSYHF